MFSGFRMNSNLRIQSNRLHSDWSTMSEAINIEECKDIYKAYTVISKLDRHFSFDNVSFFVYSVGPWSKLMLTCAARPGRMWFHEPMLKTVVSAPQSPNDCAFGSEICSVCVLGLWQACGGVSVFSLQTKTWPVLWSEVETHSLSTVHNQNGLCFFARKYLCVWLAVKKFPAWSHSNMMDCWESCWSFKVWQGWIGQL